MKKYSTQALAALRAYLETFNPEAALAEKTRQYNELVATVDGDATKLTQTDFDFVTQEDKDAYYNRLMKHGVIQPSSIRLGVPAQIAGEARPNQTQPQANFFLVLNNLYTGNQYQASLQTLGDYNRVITGQDRNRLVDPRLIVEENTIQREFKAARALKPNFQLKAKLRIPRGTSYYLGKYYRHLAEGVAIRCHAAGVNVDQALLAQLKITHLELSPYPSQGFGDLLPLPKRVAQPVKDRALADDLKALATAPSTKYVLGLIVERIIRHLSLPNDPEPFIVFRSTKYALPLIDAFIEEVNQNTTLPTIDRAALMPYFYYMTNPSGGWVNENNVRNVATDQPLDMARLLDSILPSKLS